MVLHELVDPVGVLHLVRGEDVLHFCSKHSLERPDNVARLSDESSKWRYSQGWQALKKVRWLKCVDPQTLERIKGVPLQPVLGTVLYRFYIM